MQQALQDMLSTIYQPLPGPSTEQMMAALNPTIPDPDDDAPDIDLSTLTQLQNRILALLARHGEMFGQDIMATLELQNSTVYSSLARLEQMHLIRKRVLPENKKYKLYSLNWKTAQ
jgi:DNA-binding MarR family transcriptional regulator